jgi:hypothetical protein
VSLAGLNGVGYETSEEVALLVMLLRGLLLFLLEFVVPLRKLIRERGVVGGGGGVFIGSDFV